MHHYHQQVFDRRLDRILQPFSLPISLGAWSLKEPTFPLPYFWPPKRSPSGRWTCMAREQAVMTYRPASAVKEASPHTRISRARYMKPQRHTYQATRTDKGGNGRGRGKQGKGSVAEVIRLVMNDLSPFTGRSESGNFDATPCEGAQA